MNARQIELVQHSWSRIAPSAEIAGELFYGKLFVLDPSLKSMFRGDIREQGRKLMAMITFAVNGLTRLDAIAPGLQALGRRHAGYGVEDRHYALVASALLWTLEKGLANKFTDEVRDAWLSAYNTLAATMREASRVPVEA